MDSGAEHPREQVRLSWKGREAYVVKALAPFLLALWKAGVPVHLVRLEDSTGKVVAYFASPNEAKQFLNLIAAFLPGAELDGADIWDSLYGRIFRHGSPDDWVYDPTLLDLAVVEEEDDEEGGGQVYSDGPPYCEFEMEVRFPATDIPILLKLLERVPAGGMSRPKLTEGGLDLEELLSFLQEFTSWGPLEDQPAYRFLEASKLDQAARSLAALAEVFRWAADWRAYAERVSSHRVGRRGPVLKFPERWG